MTSLATLDGKQNGGGGGGGGVMEDDDSEDDSRANSHNGDVAHKADSGTDVSWMQRHLVFPVRTLCMTFPSNAAPTANGVW